MRHWFGGLVAALWVSGVGTPAFGEKNETSEGATEGPLPVVTPPAYYDPPLPAPLDPPRQRARWGAQFRLEGAPMGKDAAPDAKMGGFGLSLRPRPSPSFAVDIGIDLMGGRDFNGEKRSEQALTLNPMLFLNPRSKVSVYLFGGLGLSGARVEHAGGRVSHYRYIGIDGGAGLEFHFWRRVAIDTDFLAFVRDRTDRESARYPEYVDPATGRFTNTSQGILLRAGVVYYW